MLVAFAAMMLGQVEPVDKIFDHNAILAAPLDARVLKATEKGGIVTEQVMFHSEKDGGKSVDLFAYFSYPKGAKKLPAFVWNQGGLYQATTHFTELGARRGYAALCIDFPIPGYRSTGGYPINSGLELTDDPRKAPIYHGAVALLRAVSFLESRPEVDKNKIGMAGSSWGGFYTTLMAGVDPRLKACSSMFGSGNLQMGNSWWDGQGPNAKRDAAFRERWRTTLDSAFRLRKSKTPIAWFTGTNDSFYWLPGVIKSYEQASGPRHLSVLPNWNHALTPILDEQVFAWLDVHLKGAPAFLKTGPLEVAKDNRSARWSFEGPRKAAAAQLLVSYGEPDYWVSRYWHTLPAQFQDGKCTAVLPKASLPCLAIGTVIDDKGFHYATTLQRVEITDRNAEHVPIYDGCSMWGGFRKEQMEFLTLHGLPAPAIVMAENKPVASLKAGKTILGPVHFAAGVPHVLRVKAKADGATKVTITLQGTFDGKMHAAEKSADLTKEWSEVRLDFTPPTALSASLAPTIVLPAKASVLVERVRFEPVRK